MIKLYFSLFYRRIKAKLSLFLLNFIGYIILLSVISLTTLFIYGELTYDNFKKKDRIYRVISSVTFGSKPAYTTTSSASKLEEIKEEYPEIESLVNMFFVRDINIKSTQKQLTQNVIFFKGDFLNIFTPDFIYVDTTSFNQASNVCFITKSFSEHLFGTDNSIGENLFLINKNDTILVKVEGVINDFKNTTCMQGDIFVKSEAEFDFYDDIASLSFILLKENSIIDKLNNVKVEEYENNGVKFKKSIFFQPIREVYLKSDFLDFNFYPSGNLKLLIVFIIAVLLMLLCIIFNYNFMFIVLIRARVKEFSLKRILGLDKKKILYGIIFDSALFVLISSCFAYLICKKILYSIESLNVVLKNYFQWFNIVFIIVFAVIMIITVVIPLMYYKSIIRFKRLDRLKYNNEINRKKIFGVILLGIQVIVVFVLIAFTFIVESQLQYAINRDLGIKNRNLVIFNNELSEHEYDLLSEELKKMSIISDVTRIGVVPPSTFPQAMIRIKCKGDVEKDVMTAMLFVDKNTLETLGVTYIKGEGFENYSNCESYCVVSESLANQLGINNIIGYEVQPGMKIIGVIKDISMVPVRKHNFPLIISYNTRMCKKILVGYVGQNVPIAKNISKIYESIIGERPNYTFYEEHLKSLYKEENFMLKYIVTFSTITLLIVFLGFYFYSRSVVDLKSKDIVIRKIHGASFYDIVKLLMKEYFAVFIVSIIIACLLFSYISNMWLSGFTFHIDKSLKHYLYPTTLIVVVLLIAVLNSVLRLAHKNIVATINNYR